MKTEETTKINDEKYGIKECDSMQASFRAFLFERLEFISCWLPDLYIGCPPDSVLDVNSAYKLGGAGTNIQGKLHGNFVGAISVRSTCLCNMNRTPSSVRWIHWCRSQSNRNHLLSNQDLNKLESFNYTLAERKTCRERMLLNL